MAAWKDYATRKKYEEKYAKYGHPGDTIAGSKLFRSYCWLCEEPIRVSASVVGKVAVCTDCDGPHDTHTAHMTPRQRAKYGTSGP